MLGRVDLANFLNGGGKCDQQQKPETRRDKARKSVALFGGAQFSGGLFRRKGLLIKEFFFVVVIVG